MDHISGDLQAEYIPQRKGGGFAGLVLYDTDDYDRFVMGEDEMIALYAYLGRKLAEDGLIPSLESGDL